MGNSSQLERVVVNKIFSFERKLWFHDGSFYVVLPKEIMRANMVKKNANCKVIFSHAIDEKTGRILMILDINP